MLRAQPVSFLINKSTVTLKVSLQSNRSVVIVPHECKTENLRLWQSIAQAQNTMAQMEMETRRELDSRTLLLSLFDNHSWTIEML